MKRALPVIVLLAAAAALFLVLRNGGDSSETDPSASTGDTPRAPVGVRGKQVTLTRSGAGETQSVALMDDDPPGTLMLEGQVIDSSEAGVDGALVTLGSNPPRSTRTSEDGSFQFNKLVGRSYRLVARADSGIAGPVNARLTGKSDPIILRLRPAAAVEVKVITAVDRKPLAGATVELRDLDVQTVTTDASGVAHLLNIVPGSYRLAAYAEGFAKTHAWVRVPPGNVTAVTTMIVRRGAAVSGRVVTPEGSPVQGARVTYSGASDWAQQADPRHDAVMSDAEGKFRINALPAGSFRFVARADGFAPGRSEMQTLDGMSERGDVLIRMDEGATILGTVKSEDGQPMAAARVRVAVKVAGMRWAQPRQAFTNDTGEFSIGGIPQKQVQVVAQHETAASEIVQLDLSSKTEEKVDLVLAITGTISGIVVDSTGEPIEGAQVSGMPDFGTRAGRRNARRNMRLRGFQRELTDAGGNFVITGLEPGDYRLRATPPGAAGGWARRMVRDATSAKTGDDNVRIVLPADGGVKGTLAYDDGTAPGIFTLSVGFRTGTPFNNKDGKFELGQLPPKEYTVTIRGPGFDAKEVPSVLVKEGEITDMGTVTVHKGRSISGRVTANGRPVQGATVQAGRRLFGSGSSAKAAFSPFGRGGTKETETDQDGTFVLSGVGPSDIMVVAEHEKMGRSQALPIRQTRDSIFDLELQLQPFSTLSGKVTKAGKPAENVRVSVSSQTTPSVVFGVGTGADGTYRFDRLAPDTYKASAIGGGNPMAGMGFYSKLVTIELGQNATLDLELDEGAVSVEVTPRVTNSDKPLNFALVNYVVGDITATSARQLELAIAQVPEGRSGFSMSIRGSSARLSGLQPNRYTVCVTPYPVEVSGMSDTRAYMAREGDNMKVFCKVVNVPSEPVEQKAEVPIEIPAYVPSPDAPPSDGAGDGPGDGPGDGAGSGEAG